MNSGKLHDECGVAGVYLTRGGAAEAARRTYYGLVSLQHRGQESCGISVSDGEDIRTKRDMGLVQEVFCRADLNTLEGFAALGHVRYSTAGCSSIENAQPFTGSFRMGNVAVAHNGQLVNYRALRRELQDAGNTFSSTSDTEVILKLIARSVSTAARVGEEWSIDSAIKEVMSAIRGSYALVIMTEQSLIGVRDPCGIRPLILGQIIGTDGNAAGYALASESCALDAMGAVPVRDIASGEAVVISDSGVRTACCHPLAAKHCIFEYVYFARPDSVVDGIAVEEAREYMGRHLAAESKVDADVVVGVPDSGLGAAAGYAAESGIPCGMGIIKNKYVGRSFIAPTQAQREEVVSVKLNAVRSVIGGKRVIVIDDSIVRGTTSRRLVSLLRRAGAREVHFRVSSPHVLHPCYFGIDTPSVEELASARMNDEELCREIGADSLRFLSLDGMIAALRECAPAASETAMERRGVGFCEGCFNGHYPVEVGGEL